jgi:hypothetical protein
MDLLRRNNTSDAQTAIAAWLLNACLLFYKQQVKMPTLQGTKLIAEKRIFLYGTD